MNVWGHRKASDAAWNVMKSFMYQGKQGDLEDIMPLLQGTMDRYDTWSGSPLTGNAKTKLKPVYRVPSSAGAKKPMKQMELAGMPGAKFSSQQEALLNRIPGFTRPEKGGIPTFINWWGGKSGLKNVFRQMYKPFQDTHKPAEMFGGSGSMLTGLNAGKGIYNEMNPDLTNAMRMAQLGLQVPDFGPNTKEVLADITQRLNALRYKRDIEQEEMTPEENELMAQLFISANSRAFQGNMGYKQNDEWHTGAGRMKPGLRTVRPDRGSPAIPFDLRPWADRMKNWEVHEGKMQDLAELLGPEVFMYLDPPYWGRTFDYTDNPNEAGRVLDDLQRETIDIGAEHEGPVAYSNYLLDPDTREPYHEAIEYLLNQGYDITPWARNIKTGKTGGKNVVEMLATRNMPEWEGMKEKLPKVSAAQQSLLEF